MERPESASSEKSPSRLIFLEGIRGLAAMYVVFFHVLQAYRPSLPPGSMRYLGWLFHGRVSVCVFIALSGYCLMLTTVRKPDQRGLPLGTFVRRRAVRILPPYYAALIFSIMAFLASPKLLAALHGSVDPAWAKHFAPDNLLVHALLLENVFPHWGAMFDGPMWSVATEWQIYFVFAVILLPLWRRLGDAASLLAAGALSAICTMLLGGRPPQDRMFVAPWFIAIFAMGMAAASISFPASSLRFRLRDRVPWAWICGVLAAANLVLLCRFNDDDNSICLDLLHGLTASCWLIAVTRPTPLASRFTAMLSVVPLVRLGEFSYSLYLMHQPLLMKLWPMYQALHLTPTREFILFTATAVPVTVALSYAFFRIFERPFMHRIGHAKPLRVSPAPAMDMPLAVPAG